MQCQCQCQCVNVQLNAERPYAETPKRSPLRRFRTELAFEGGNFIAGSSRYRAGRRRRQRGSDFPLFRPRDACIQRSNLR